MQVYSFSPSALNKTFTGCIVIVQGSEVEEYSVIKSCQGEFYFLESMEKVASQGLLGNPVLPSEPQWCECAAGDSVFFNSSDSVGRSNREETAESLVILVAGLSRRYFGSKPMEIFEPRHPLGTWAGWQKWRHCIQSWWKSTGRWHTEQARTRPA